MVRAIWLIIALFWSPTIAHAGDVVAAHTLRVGVVLDRSDLRAASDEALDAAESMVGQEVRRAIYAGHSVKAADLGPPTLVKRNEVVVMRFRSGPLEIRAEGRALGRGGLGETVDVMNLASRQTVRAVVKGHGRVEVRR